MLDPRIKSELEHINTNFEFSEECPTEIRNYILRHNLAYTDTDEVLFLSATGENLLGLEESNFDAEDDITEGFFYENGDESEY